MACSYFYTRINQLHGLHGLFEKKTKQQQYIVYAFNIIFINSKSSATKKAQCMRYQTYQFFLLKVRYVNREGKGNIVIAYREKKNIASHVITDKFHSSDQSTLESRLLKCKPYQYFVLIITNIFNIVYCFPWRYYCCLFDHD